MVTEYFDLKNGNRIIKCKVMKPDSGVVGGVILGIHGFCGDKESSMLTMLARRMQMHGIAIVCFDLPAHGDSLESDEALTVNNCIDDILFMVDWCRKEFICGHRAVFATSYGGFLALNCISELSDFEMILRAPAVTMPEHILLDIMGMTADEFRKAESKEIGFDRKIKLSYKFYEELCNYNVAQKSFNKSALIIHGDSDDVVPYSDILEFCNRNPSMKLWVMQGADHRFKNPGEIERIIERTEKYLIVKWDRV